MHYYRPISKYVSYCGGNFSKEEMTVNPGHITCVSCIKALLEHGEHWPIQTKLDDIQGAFNITWGGIKES
jgi:hypothetical protein